jgi:Domain of unknown function (DUF4351)
MAIFDFVNRLPFVQKAKTKTQAQLMVQQLKRIIGSITPAQQQRIHSLSAAQMNALAQAADDFSMPEDLDAWLAAQR